MGANQTRGFEQPVDYNAHMGPQQKMNDKKRVEFAKQIEYMYEAVNPSWRRLLTFAFLKGIATGFGIFIGGTIVVAILLWILSGLDHIPFLKTMVDAVQETLKQK